MNIETMIKKLEENKISVIGHELPVGKLDGEIRLTETISIQFGKRYAGIGEIFFKDGKIAGIRHLTNYKSHSEIIDEAIKLFN